MTNKEVFDLYTFFYRKSKREKVISRIIEALEESIKSLESKGYTETDAVFMLRESLT